MGASATFSMQIAAVRPCISSSTRVSSSKMLSLAKTSFYGSYHAISSTKHLTLSCPVARSSGKLITRAMSQDTASTGSYGLPIDLRGTVVPVLVKYCTLWEWVSCEFPGMVGISMLRSKLKWYYMVSGLSPEGKVNCCNS
jgi:hypothetical protein